MSCQFHYSYRGASDGSHYEKRGKGEPVCVDDEIPFEIPESWEWARLESITTYIQRGKSPKYSSIEQYPVVAQKCNQWSGFSLEKAKFIDPSTVLSYADERTLCDGDLLWNSTGLGTLGRMAIYDSSVNKYGWAVADSHVTVIRTDAEWFNYRFAFAYFAGPSVQSVIEDLASGSTKQKELAQDTIKNYLIPIPPLVEQRRIAERVSELIPLVEEYGKLEDKRGALDAELPDRLRNSILQLAVQGKLVPQDPNDEPASALLERIRTERAQLIKEKKIKVPKSGESVIYRASDGGYYEKRGKGEAQPIEVPFDIPSNWEWARVSTVFNLVRGSGIKRTEVTDEGIPCVRYGELYTTYEAEIVKPTSKTSEDVFDKAQKLLPDEAVATLTGENDTDIGRTVVNSTNQTIAFGGDLLGLKGGYIDGHFAALSMNSPYMGIQRTALASGNIIVHLSADKIGSFLIAVPPIEEQRRIVSRVTSLLAAIG